MIFPLPILTLLIISEGFSIGHDEDLVLTSTAKDGKSTAGSDLNFTCLDKSRQIKEKYFMTKDGVEQDDIEAYSLHYWATINTYTEFLLMNIDEDDSGKYRCVAIDRNGKYSHSNEIDISIRSDENSISSDLKDFDYNHHFFATRPDGLHFDPILSDGNSSLICVFPKRLSNSLNLSLDIMAGNETIRSNVVASTMKKYGRKHEMLSINSTELSNIMKNRSLSISNFSCRIVNHTSNEIYKKFSHEWKNINYTIHSIKQMQTLMNILSSANISSNTSVIHNVTTPTLEPVTTLSTTDHNSTSTNHSVQNHTSNATTTAVPIPDHATNETNANHTHGNLSMKIEMRRLLRDIVVQCAVSNLTGNETVVMEYNEKMIPLSDSKYSKNHSEWTLIDIDDKKLTEYSCAVYDGEKMIQRWVLKTDYYVRLSEKNQTSFQKKEFKYFDLYPMIYFEDYRTINYIPLGSRFVKKCVAQGLGHDRVQMYFKRRNLMEDKRITIEHKSMITVITFEIASVTSKDYGKYDCKWRYQKNQVSLSFMLKRDRI